MLTYRCVHGVFEWGKGIVGMWMSFGRVGSTGLGSSGSSGIWGISGKCGSSGLGIFGNSGFGRVGTWGNGGSSGFGSSTLGKDGSSGFGSSGKVVSNKLRAFTQKSVTCIDVSVTITSSKRVDEWNELAISWVGMVKSWLIGSKLFEALVEYVLMLVSLGLNTGDGWGKVQLH